MQIGAKSAPQRATLEQGWERGRCRSQEKWIHLLVWQWRDNDSICFETSFDICLFESMTYNDWFGYSCLPGNLSFRFRFLAHLWTVAGFFLGCVCHDWPSPLTLFWWLPKKGIPTSSEICHVQRRIQWLFWGPLLKEALMLESVGNKKWDLKIENTN